MRIFGSYSQAEAWVERNCPLAVRVTVRYWQQMAHGPIVMQAEMLHVLEGYPPHLITSEATNFGC